MVLEQFREQLRDDLPRESGPPKLIGRQDADRAKSVMHAMLQMKKIDCNALREAYEQPIHA